MIDNKFGITYNLLHGPPGTGRVQIGSRWHYKDKLYTVRAELEFKHPDTREWLLGVAYESDAGELYCRHLNEFLERFKKEE